MNSTMRYITALLAIVLLSTCVNAEVTGEQPRVIFYGIMLFVGLLLFGLGEFTTPLATVLAGFILCAAGFYGGIHIVDEAAQIFNTVIVGAGLLIIVRGAFKLNGQ